MDASDQDGKRGYPWNVTAQNSRRRQQVGRLIHSIWTGDCGDAGLAAPYFDGRLDLLGLYQTFLVDQVLVDDDEGNNCFTFNEEGKAYFEVEREHCSTLTYEQFEQSYMRANQPVVIQGLARDWKASSDWVHQASDGTVEPNLLYLQQHFGNDLVDVFEQSQAGFSASRPIRRKMTITEYARWWEQHRVAGETQLIYMKDWKFLISHPKCGAYQCPHYFQEDWLNMATKNAYSFCYVGPRGTSTVLHADVLLSFSWSTNVCGRKKWFLVPPELTFLLYDCFGTKLATHLHSDVHDGMSCRFPGLRVARKHAYMLIQEAGETIFVPSKWFHTVQNLDACLSINHNWLNGANIQNSYENFEKEVLALQSAGEDLSDCSPVAADAKLLWSVIATAISSGSVQMQDMGTILAIVEAGVDKLNLYRYIDGGESEVKRVRELMREQATGSVNQ